MNYSLNSANSILRGDLLKRWHFGVDADITNLSGITQYFIDETRKNPDTGIHYYGCARTYTKHDADRFYAQNLPPNPDFEHGPYNAPWEHSVYTLEEVKEVEKKNPGLLQPQEDFFEFAHHVNATPVDTPPSTPEQKPSDLNQTRAENCAKGQVKAHTERLYAQVETMALLMKLCCETNKPLTKADFKEACDKAGLPELSKKSRVIIREYAPAGSIKGAGAVSKK